MGWGLSWGHCVGGTRWWLHGGGGGGVTPVRVGGLRQGWLWWRQEGRVGTWDHGG